MKKIVFLVSGRGGNLVFVNETINLLNLPFKVIGVLGDRNCHALDYAKENSIYSKKIEYSRNNNIALKEELIKLNPDFIITNFHKIIDSEIVGLFKSKLINLHYSLLPSFSGHIGMKTLELAKNKNVKIIGTTTHQVDEIVDNGKILTQSCICIDWDKDILIEDVIFKSGCVCLLNALLLEINTKNLEVYSLNLNQKNVIISPPLCFDISKINNEFWNKIKLLS